MMDMAVRTFDKVEGFFMYYVPGIVHLENAIEEARQRWGVPIHMVPHWSSLMALKNGIYCDSSQATEKIPNLSLWNIYASMIKMTGIGLILTGMKRSDSNSRRRYMEWSKSNRHIVHPIAGWRKRDVIGYLSAQGIALPPSSGAATTGVDLTDTELLWLHDTFPEDYKALIRYFPYAHSVVMRRKFYGE